jgi:hypothetical protein
VSSKEKLKEQNQLNRSPLEFNELCRIPQDIVPEPPLQMKIEKELRNLMEDCPHSNSN